MEGHESLDAAGGALLRGRETGVVEISTAASAPSFPIAPSARRPPSARSWLGPIVRLVGLVLLVSPLAPPGHGQSLPDTPTGVTAQVPQLLRRERWADVVATLESLPHKNAEMDFAYVTALAQLGRYQEARAAFLAGRLRERLLGHALFPRCESRCRGEVLEPHREAAHRGDPA